MNNNRRNYGKYVPQTYNAIYIGGHYQDPRSVVIRIKSILSVSGITAAIVFPIIIGHLHW